MFPVYLDEYLPGDSHTIRLNVFGRLATPLHPIMDNLRMDLFFFGVPNRLLYDNWERLNGAQDNPGDTTDYLTPQTVSPTGGWKTGSLADYFGLPLGIAGLSVSALPFRAVNLIWNDWFRDQNLMDSVPVPTGDGPDDFDLNYSSYGSSGADLLPRRGKRHDYFTSALPWPQKGPSVPLPLGDFAPVEGIGGVAGTNFAQGPVTAYETGAKQDSWLQHTDAQLTGKNLIMEEDPNNPGYPNVWANLSEATAATINTLRQTFQLQKLYERDARGGTRYIEIIKSHFGVTSPDARLQRPEYLGSRSVPIIINPIAQTSASDAQPTPQGNLAAMGVVNAELTVSKGFVEHGWIIGFGIVRADLTYQQGIDRMWTRSTRWDYYWPAFSHLGEQVVERREIYADGTGDSTADPPTGDYSVFGYQERYAEYRYKRSLITGKFRSSDPESLDTWHLSQDFPTPPVLGEQFMEENPPVARVIAVPTEPHVILDVAYDTRSARPMPTYSVPGLIDHF